MLVPPPTAEDGLFDRADASAAGWSKGRVDRALASGRLTALVPGALVLTGDLELRTPLERYLLLVRAHQRRLSDDWYAGSRCGAVVHGLPLLGKAPAQALLTRQRRSQTERSSSRFRRISELPPDEVDVVRGVPVTSLARTTYDLARSHSTAAALVAADAALRTGLLRSELQRLVGRHQGWPGNREARLVADLADGRAESPLESLGRVACHDQGLPLFTPQVEVWRRDELVARVDGLWEPWLLVFEGDGALKFTDAGVLPALLERQEVLRSCGLDVVRAGWNDVYKRQRAWARVVRQRLAERTDPRLAPGVRLVPTVVRPVPLDLSDHYRWPDPPLVSAAPRRDALEGRARRGAA